jgi:hypothetical protein
MRRLFEKPTVADTAARIEELLVEEIQGLSDEEVEGQVQAPTASVV